MTRHAIDITGLSKRYRLGQSAGLDRTLRDAMGGLLRRKQRSTNPRELWALRDVSFHVEPGEVVGIIGRNGAGKSTLLKILSRITDPSEGRVAMRGRIASLLEVGTGFHPELTGRENVYLNGAILGMSRREVSGKFDQIIDFSGVEAFLDTPVKRYSSGMRVRLAFAVAAHLEPEILVVDEVLAVGDAAFQNKCLGQMREASRKGDRTVLFVSHNMSAVQTLCDRTAWLEDGTLRQIGSTPDVIDAYLSNESQRDHHDTDDLPRPADHFGRDARIVRIEPMAPRDGGFHHNESIALDVDIRATRSASSVRFGLSLRDLAGGAVLSAFTPGSLDLVAGATGRYRVTLDDTRLAPGSYAVSLSIGHGHADEARRELDIVRDGPGLTVLPTTPAGSTLFNWHRDYGPIVHPQATATPLTRNADEARRAA